ncbi:LysR family transcriptional regulator [Variovorax sp.]|uniref:LysR family transcriptional regulator n=1 Tax=Variovorax sp. TaxID=1871043 RepID=UPI002D496E8F|nr:LysR family transcriptional regulator [Variovorax sp.]HYP83658.1 LysR family transcriptional regulator [Variovorax sp.]
MHAFSHSIRYFEEVAAQKSIRRAAERLNIAPSAVARQIARLEEQLGVPVFERLPRGVRLTAAGEMMLAQVRRMQREFGAALAQVDALKGTRRGHIGIGVLQYMSAQFVPQLIVDVAKDHPGLSYTVQTGNSPEIVDAVVRGDLDIGLCWQPAASMPVRNVRAVQVPVGVVVAADHELAQRRTMRVAECLTYPLIIQSQDTALRRMVEDVTRGASTRVMPFVETNSIAAMVALLVAGAGIAIMTRATVHGELARGVLRHIPISDRGVGSVSLALFVRADRALSPPVALLLELLESRFDAFAGGAPPARRAARSALP